MTSSQPGGGATAADASHHIGNDTPRRMVILGAEDARIELAPLEQRHFDRAALAPFDLAKLGRRREVRLSSSVPSDNGIFVIGLGFWLLVGYLVLAFIVRSGWVWGFGGLALVAILGFGLALARRGGGEIWQWVVQQLNLVAAVLVGVGLPGLAIWSVSGLSVAYAAGEEWRALLAPQAAQETLGRALQFVFLSGASLFPALLYFLFDRERLRTLRDRFVRQVFRLVPEMLTLSDVEARYGARIEDAFGHDRAGASARLTGGRGGTRLVGGRRSPVFLATVLLTVGWTLTMLNPDAGSGESFRLEDLFRPEPSPLAFGFLGAYIFSLNSVLRAYLRSDLRPKTYSGISVRLIVVLVLSNLIALTFPADGVARLLAAFATGMFPESILRWLVARSDSLGLGKEAGSLSARASLTVLEEIDAYDRARLQDEGVHNVEALAHHDLVDLLLQTRIPASRIIDWVDQAVLYLRARPEDEGTGPGLLQRLRDFGIRNATDLHRVLAQVDGDERGRLMARLDPQLSADEPRRLQTLLVAMEDEDGLRNLIAWRSAETASAPEPVVVDAVPAAGLAVTPPSPSGRVLSPVPAAEAVGAEPLAVAPASSGLLPANQDPPR